MLKFNFSKGSLKFFRQEPTSRSRDDLIVKWIPSALYYLQFRRNTIQIYLVWHVTSVNDTVRVVEYGYTMRIFYFTACSDSF